MTTTVGAGDSRYEERHDWPRLPEGWSFREVVDVAVDGQDRVCVFNRGQQPVMVFEADGTLAGAWGEGMFTRPHGLTAGPDGALWAADDDGHCVRRFTWDGELQLTIGIPGQGAEPHSGEPFNRPTKVAVAPRSGEIYIADGYGNARVHKYSPEGEHLLSWGEFGTGPGQFNLVHSVCTDDAGRVFVADRENHRVQIFDDQGAYLDQWNDMHRPCGLLVSGDRVYIGTVAQPPRRQRRLPEHRRLRHHPRPRRQPARPPRRRPPRRGAGGVHGAPRFGRRLAGRPVRGRGLLERLGPAPGSAAAGALLPQAGPGVKGSAGMGRRRTASRDREISYTHGWRP